MRQIAYPDQYLNTQHRFYGMRSMMRNITPAFKLVGIYDTDPARQFGMNT